MTAVVVDASVWVAAADPTEVSHLSAHRLLLELAARRITILVPSLLRVEVACALRRRLGDGNGAVAQVRTFLDAPFVIEVPLDRERADAAMSVGVEQRLSGADAVYSALARSEDAVLITLDRELLERADGVTPADWVRRS